MKITYDPAKRAITLIERKLDFERAPEIFAGLQYTFKDGREDYGETRNITIGHLDKRMVVLVWTPRGAVRHIISLRKANAKEQKTTKKTWVDPDDAPELTREWFQQADLYYSKTLIRRGRPPKEEKNKKVSIHLRVDPEIAAAFRASGKGWQTRANAILKAWVAAHPNG